MKTFYSIIYAVITPETGERIALGLLLSDGINSRFRYSRTKLSALYALMPFEQQSFIKDYLRSIEKSGPPKIIDQTQTAIPVFESPTQLVSESYIEYLNTYNQNVIAFSKPVKIDVEISDSIVDQLFSNLINEKKLTPLSEKHQIIKVKENFIPTVTSYFNYDLEVTPDEYPTLLMPIKIDLIGKNKIPVFARFFDFEKTPQYLKNDLFDLDYLQKAFEQSKGFLVSSEPDKEQFHFQHIAWNHFRNSSTLEYIDSKEVERIREYAVEHGVKPW